MGRSIRIVGYAVNGSGTGHLMRLVAIGRWLRRYAACAGVRAEIYMLTSSEADSLLFAERFASFKVPSKTAVADAGIDKVTYLALAKQWVWHSIGLLRPDLFVVDTFPRGSFGELLSALDLCKKRAFIYRPTKESFAARPDFQAMLPLYDAILVPEREEDAPVLVPDAARPRVRYTGPIAARERAEMHSRAEARAQLGIGEDAFAVYISAGGGGDTGAEAQILGACSALLDLAADVHLVVGAGPLYRGRCLHAPRVTWLAQAGSVAELMPAFDVAVCAAGYNTFCELMLAGVPAVFLPQEKIADEQRARAERAVKAGAGVVLRRVGDAQALRDAVAHFRDPAARASASEAARALVPRSHARDAASALLRLVLPAWEVDAAEEAMTDNVLEAARDLGVSTEPFLEAMQMLAGESADGIGGPDPGLVSDLAVSLLRASDALGVPTEAALRIAGALGRRLVRATPEERAAAARQAFLALAPFNDWSGAVVLMRLFGAEPKLTSVAALSGELTALLTKLKARGADLYGAIDLLARGAGAGGDLSRTDPEAT